MSSTVGEAVVEVRGDVNRLKSDISGAGRTAGHGFASGFRENLKGLAETIGLIYAGEKGLEFLKGSVEAAREANKVAAVTQARIKSTGGAAHVTAKQVGELGDKLAQQDGIMPDLIKSGENMLLTFKNIRNEQGKNNDIFDQSTSVMLDLAASMAGNGQINTKTAAIQLGKALNDPIKGISSLSRVGVQFTDQQKKTIESLVKSGHTLEAQKIILKELNSEFGGTARAQSNASDRMKAAWHVLEEEVGNLLIPILDKLERFLTTKGIPKAQEFVHQMKDGRGAGGKFASALSDVWDAGKRVFSVIGDVVGALDKMPDWAKKVLITGAIGGFAAKKLGITALLAPAAKGIGGLVASEKPIPVFVVNKGFGVPGGGGGGGGVLGTAEKVGAGAAGAGATSTSLALAALTLPALVPLVGSYFATHVLKGQNESTFKQGTAQGESTAGAGGGLSLPTDLGKQLVTDSTGKPLSIFPKGFLTDLTSGVARVKDFKDTLAGLGLLTPSIRKELDGLGKTKVKPEIGANSAPLEGHYRQSKNLLIELGKQHPVSTIDGNNKPGMAATREILHSLGIVDHFKANPSINVNGAQAMQTLARVKQEFDQIHDKSVTITVNHHQAGTQVGTNAAGSWSWRGGPTLVGEHGREIVDIPRGSRVVPNPQTETILGSARGQLVQNIYLPTGDPQAAAAAAASRWVLAGLN